MLFGCSRIAFNHETKIVSEKMLKALDEYFYLGFGRKFHLFVLPSKQEDQHRSWINIAVKVVSYCSLILPLIGFMAGTVLLAYLNWQDPPPTLDREDLPPIPQEKIEILKREPSAEDLQSDLVQLITSPTLLNIDSVAAIMDPLLELMINEPESAEEIIQCHTQIADLLANAGPSVRSEQIHTFFKYLVHKYPDSRPWLLCESSSNIIANVNAINQITTGGHELSQFILANDRKKFISKTTGAF